MKVGGMFISAILIVDTFFVSYCLSFHSRSVNVEDPSMKPYVKPVEKKKEETPKPSTTTKPAAGKPAETKPATAATKKKPATTSTKKKTQPAAKKKSSKPE